MLNPNPNPKISYHKINFEKAPTDGNSLRTLATRTKVWRVQKETKTKTLCPKTKTLKLNLATKTWFPRTTSLVKGDHCCCSQRHKLYTGLLPLTDAFVHCCKHRNHVLFPIFYFMWVLSSVSVQLIDYVSTGILFLLGLEPSLVDDAARLDQQWNWLFVMLRSK